MNRDQYIQAFIADAKARGKTKEETQAKLPEALAAFDANQPKQNGFLQGQALPIGGAVLGGAVGMIGGPPLAAAGAGAGYVGGDVIRKLLGQLTGVQNQPTEPLKNIGETALGGAISSAAGYAGGAIIPPLLEKAQGVIQNVIGAKSINPWKVTGYAEQQAINKTPTLDVQEIIKQGDHLAQKVTPQAKEAWEIEKQALINGKSTIANTPDVLAQIGSWGKQTYSPTGNVKDKAVARFFNLLIPKAREVIAIQAPEIAKQTKNFATLYDIPKDLQKWTWLLAKLGIAKNILP